MTVTVTQIRSLIERRMNEYLAKADAAVPDGLAVAEYAATADGLAEALDIIDRETGN